MTALTVRVDIRLATATTQLPARESERAEGLARDWELERRANNATALLAPIDVADFSDGDLCLRLGKLIGTALAPVSSCRVARRSPGCLG